MIPAWLLWWGKVKNVVWFPKCWPGASDTPQLLHFRSRPESPPYLEEEIAYPTSEDPIKMHRKKRYVIFFETWLVVDAPARKLFSTDKYRFLGNASANHFLSLHQTRASRRRDLTWELKGGITFYSLLLFSFLESNFENAQVANPCRRTLSVSTSELATETCWKCYSKRSFADFPVFDMWA